MDLNDLAIGHSKRQMELKPEGKKTCGKIEVQLDEKRRDETWTDITHWTLRAEENVESCHSSIPFELCAQHKYDTSFSRLWTC